MQSKISSGSGGLCNTALITSVLNSPVNFMESWDKCGCGDISGLLIEFMSAFSNCAVSFRNSPRFPHSLGANTGCILIVNVIVRIAIRRLPLSTSCVLHMTIRELSLEGF